MTDQAYSPKSLEEAWAELVKQIADILAAVGMPYEAYLALALPVEAKAKALALAARGATRAEIEQLGE